jgi:hypothetical protein
MKRLFAALLRLYPPAWREMFADEMAAVFDNAMRDRRSRGWASYPIFLMAELFGLLQGAATAWGIDLWQRRAILAIFPFLAGAFVSAAILRPFVSIRISLPPVESHSYTREEISALMAIVAISIVLLAGISVSVVINMRVLAWRRQSSAHKGVL